LFEFRCIADEAIESALHGGIRKPTIFIYSLAQSDDGSKICNDLEWMISSSHEHQAGVGSEINGAPQSLRCHDLVILQIFTDLKAVGYPR
jgi:hypothetical protein